LGGPRPARTGWAAACPIVSNDPFNSRSGTVIAMAITGKAQKGGFPLTLPLPFDLLAKPSWVKIGQIRTISVERLGKRLVRACRR